MERISELWGLVDWPHIESLILEDFKRRAPYYLEHLPPDNEPFEWASLLQHYGAPTRLLDVTDSFYAALFFAVEAGPYDAALWAFDATRLIAKPNTNKLVSRRLDLQIHRDDPEARAVVNENYGKDGPLGIVQVRPFYLHPRLRMQQGSFLYQIRADSYFERNLCECMQIEPARGSQLLPTPVTVPLTELQDRVCVVSDIRAQLVKIVVKASAQGDAMAELRRMNISSETLFPGLDGLARSLQYPFQLANRRPNVTVQSSLRNLTREEVQVRVVAPFLPSESAVDGKNVSRREGDIP